MAIRELLKKGGEVPEVVKLVREDPERIREVLEVLEDESSYLRSQATWVLGELGAVNDEVVPSLLKRLEDEDKSVRVDAADALAKIGQGVTEALPVIYKALWSGDELERRTALYAVGRIGPEAKEAVPVLERILSAWVHSNEYHRYLAARALGSIGDEHAVPTLKSVLTDRDANVRKAAKEALDKIQK